MHNLERNPGRKPTGLRGLLSCLSAVAVLMTGSVRGAPAATCGDGTIEEGEDCDDGNVFGGDGCASNCTPETEILIVLDSTGNPPRSRAIVQTASFRLSLSYSGSQGGFIGEAGADGIIPVALPVDRVLFNPIAVPSLVCLCTRPDSFDDFGLNAGIGEIGCGEGGLAGTDIDTELDHNIGVVGQNGFTEVDCEAAGGTVEDGTAAHPHTGVCNGPVQVNRSGQGPKGSVVLSLYSGFDVIPDGGTCRVETSTKVCDRGPNVSLPCADSSQCAPGLCIPAKGANGIPCDFDDPDAIRGIPQLTYNTTGTTRAVVRNANAFTESVIADGGPCGQEPCLVGGTGLPLDCDQLSSGRAPGILVSSFPVLDATLAGGLRGDSVNTVILAEGDAPTFTSTPTRTETATPTPTLPDTETPTPSMTPRPVCVGDCRGSSTVSLEDLLAGVRIALGTLALTECESFDDDRDSAVTVEELVRGVTNSINDCAEGTPS